MEKIQVNLGPDSYAIEVERGLLNRAAPRIRALMPAAEKIAVITDDVVDGLYGAQLAAALESEGLLVRRIAIPHGEKSKNLIVLGQVLEEMAGFGMTRSDGVVTLSGGVPGDLGGFAAAVYLRGVPFVQMPTTILAQIDSSVGGKVAVDLESGKNLAGNFYQPKGVLIDPDLAATLPPRYIHDGMAEAVKYGCIADAGLFSLFETLQTDEDILAALPEIIRASCRIKADLVEADERDNGARMLLNFGHTIGHAIEREYLYETYTHGEAVAAGMVMLTEMTESMGITRPGTAERIAAVLAQMGLPTGAAVSREALAAHMMHDKKRRGSGITFVVLDEIGKGRLLPVPAGDIPRFIPEARHG